MTEREKIIEIVLNADVTGIKIRNITGGISTANAIADALIGAGIGEVRNAEHRAEVAERQAIFLSKMLADKTRKDYPWQAWYDYGQQQAEKEITVEKKDE